MQSLPTLFVASTLVLAAPVAFAQDPSTPVDGESKPLAPIVQVNNRFALETYRRASPGNDNLILSPASIRLALEMILAGTAGQTRTELERLLHPGWEGTLPLGEGAKLAARLRANPPVDGNLSIANALWLQEGAGHRPGYVDRIAEEFGAETALVDFRGDPADACARMNAWVSRWTGGLIPGGWRPGQLDPRLEILVTNTLHFQASWRCRFIREGGDGAPFWFTPQRRVAVQMMSMTENLRHYRDPRMEAVVIPYRGSDWSMVVVLPENVETGLTGLEQELTAGMLTKIARATKATKLHLVMPLFEIRTHVDLAEMLTGTDPLLLFQQGKADLSAMTDQTDAFLGGMDHDAYIKVDEKGTEIAAVTRVRVYGGPGPPPPPTMRVNQPFLFAVLHEPTGTILALGKLAKPAGAALPNAPYPVARPWRNPRERKLPQPGQGPVGPPVGPPPPPPVPRKKSGGG